MLLVNIQNNLGGHYCTERNGTEQSVPLLHGKEQHQPISTSGTTLQIYPTSTSQHQLYILEDRCLDPAIDSDYTLIS